MGAVCTGAGPWPSALGVGDREQDCCTCLFKIPPQLYILKHHHGAHMPDLWGGSGVGGTPDSF